MDLEIRITKDNSPTLYNEELNETYHSIHGARQESEHVYIKSGLAELTSKKRVDIFEMGFGTGLNVLLTHNFSTDNNLDVNFHSIELFPLGKEVWSKLDYAKNEPEKQFFEAIHKADWETKTQINEHFSLTKEKASLENIQYQSKFDLVYFDAFGPDKQPHLWTTPIFKKLLALLKPGGIMVTYSAKGQVRRDFQEVGFMVERIQGPPGKREMLRCRKPI